MKSSPFAIKRAKKENWLTSRLSRIGWVKSFNRALTYARQMRNINELEANGDLDVHSAEERRILVAQVRNDAYKKIGPVAKRVIYFIVYRRIRHKQDA